MNISEIPHYWRVVRHHRLLPLVWRYAIAFRDPLPDPQKLFGMYPELDREEFTAEFSDSIAPRLPFDTQTETSLLREQMLKILGAEEIVKQATDVRLHRFCFLEEQSRHLGGDINWHKDYRTDTEWPRLPAHEIVLFKGDGADIKYPWELSRCHWINWLGMAYLLDESPEWARTYERLLRSWIEENPVGIGVNWRMPMEVAIRAINWIYGWTFFAEAFELSDEFRMLMLRMLLAHGYYLENNLEYTRHPGNHLDANLAGLMALGVFFNGTAEGHRWQKRAQAMLEREIRRQVYDDGVNYEKSSGYHRLVMESFTVALAFGRRGGIDFSAEFHARLAAMAEFCATYTRPDGSTPNFGDMDNGRILRFRANEDFLYHADNIQDTVQLLAVTRKAPLQCGPSPDLLFAGEAQTMDIAGLEIEPQTSGSTDTRDSTAAADSVKIPDLARFKHFARGGYIVHSSNQHHLMFDVGDYGMDGWGGHGHNDCLAFTLWLLGAEVFCDSGTGTYGSDPELRNHLRGTRAHNTVSIGNAEQVEFGSLWRIKKDETAVNIAQLEGSQEGLRMHASHAGYLARFGCHHVRKVELDCRPEGGSLTIADSLEGTAANDAWAYFHLNPAVSYVSKGKTLEIVLPNGHATFTAEEDINLLEGPWSPAYGVVKTHHYFRLTCPGRITLDWTVSA